MTQPRRPVLRGGIDLGGTKIEAIVVDSGQHVHGSARRPTPSAGGPADVARAMGEALTDAAAAAGIAVADLAGVGVGSPGAVDEQQGIVSSARNLPGWDGSFPLAQTLEEQLGLQVRVGNDVSVATRAEHDLGAGRPYRSVLGVFWGTGVGGGLILDGKPFHGRGGAGEIGHMVVRRDGRRCPCGNRGCLEAYAGRAAMEGRARKLIAEGARSDLVSIMKRKGRDRFTSSVWEDALARADRLAMELIEEAVAALGAGIASAVNLLDVEAVIIGGGLGARFGEPYVRRIEQAMMLHLFPGHQRPAVHAAALGDLAGSIGAALLVSGTRRTSART